MMTLMPEQKPGGMIGIIRAHPKISLAMLSICVVAVIWVVKNHKPAPTAAEQQMMETQKQSILRTEANGVILYEFLTYPGVWSDPITVPQDAHYLQFRAADPKLRMEANGKEVRGHRPAPGETLQFMSPSDKPIPTTLRIFMRDATPTELAAPVPLPGENISPNTQPATTQAS